ncbi:MAG: FMN-dependent NADH-azoreductase [Planctomycetota bacterium]|jgi:FMN-dependent NADH-azoreductase
MSRLLYIQASPRGKRSHCIAVADAFVETYKQKHPDDEVITFNVFEASIPNFDGLAVQAKYTILHGKAHSKEELQAWREVEKVIEQFKSADKYVLALGMWNFSIPYRLKQYIDILVQPGYTFGYSEDTGYRGLVVGKPILVVYARGGEYPPGSETEAFDLQSKYIELIFGFMGFENIRSVVVEPTLQGGPDVAAEKRQQAVDKAKEIAVVF